MDKQALLANRLTQMMAGITRETNLNCDADLSAVEDNGESTATTQPQNDSESQNDFGVTSTADNEKFLGANCNRNTLRVIAPENERKKEFAGDGAKIILRNRRLESWLACWLEYLREVYKMAHPDEKILIETVGKLWQGVLNEEHGVYKAAIPTTKILKLLDYCGVELASNAELQGEVNYRRDFLTLATKAVIEGVIKKYSEVFNRLEDQQLMPLNIAMAMIQEAARLNWWMKNFEVEDVLQFTGGVIYEDESGVEYVLSYDVLEMCKILDGTDGAVFDE